jgi:hypothetical protein
LEATVSGSGEVFMTDTSGDRIIIPGPAIKPPNGSPLGGELVTVTRVPVDTTTTVTFGSAAAPVVSVVDSLTALVLTPPRDPSTTVAVTVTTAGQAHHPSFTYTDLRLDIVRPDDLFRLTFELVNLHVAWSPDLDPPPPPPPPGGPAPLPPPDVPGPLTADLRSRIADQAPALDVDALTLSALGATTNLHASLAVSAVNDVSDWHHVMSLGRDSYVRVVLRGYTCALPFPVAVVEVSERLPVTSAPDGALPPVPLEGLVTTTRIVFISPVVERRSPGPRPSRPPLTCPRRASPS